MGTALRVLTTPHELRRLCLQGLSRALDSHMRSRVFLLCMRQGLGWMSVVRGFDISRAASPSDQQLPRRRD